MEQACQWPDGCNRGGFRHVSMPDGRELALCLHHAGAVWNGRKSANRAAGLCACGAKPTPGRRTCERCRDRAAADKRRARNYAKLAAECGIVLPRANGRRRGFVAAYAEAFRIAQRQALKACRRSMARGGWWRGRVSATTSWEGHPVTVQAATLPDGRLAVHGIPACLVHPAPHCGTGHCARNVCRPGFAWFDKRAGTSGPRQLAGGDVPGGMSPCEGAIAAR